MSKPFHIGADTLSLQQLAELLANPHHLVLADEARGRITRCREYLEGKLRDTDSYYYGINTGFGSLCDVAIDKAQIEQLQENLVLSHSCGTGALVPIPIIKLMLLLKVHALGLGHSGVRVAVVERLLEFYNRDIIPVIYEQGSLGASGDLAPLAHLSLPLIGRGEVYYKGQTVPSAEALQAEGLQPLTLKAKEGLALLNGTQFMAAYGVETLLMAQRLTANANMIAAVSLDAFDAKTEPFNPLIHQVRPFSGQALAAQHIREWRQGSAIAEKDKPYVQDPYSFRCIPQVHGASMDVIQHVSQVFETEINSVTDNPLIFPEEDQILSGGNFHGQPLALALDYLAMGLAEFGSISERRTYQLVSGLRGLPRYLAAEEGLNSGLMIPQYTAASLVSRSKQLCSPASVDSIPSSAGQEDHVSMGANAAVQAYQVAENTERILAIELLTAMQALDFRKPISSSPRIEKLRADYRAVVSFNAQDRELYKDMEATVGFLRGR
ncbi:histidine ammonia-lyase [soil metagenome]